MEWWQTTPTRSFDTGFAKERVSEDPTWGDYGRAAKAGVQDVGAAAGAGLRFFGEGSESAGGIATEAVGRWLQDTMADYSEQNIEGMSPIAKERINAAIDSPEFWDDIISTVGLQGTRMSGSVAASVLPSLLTSGAFAATLAAGAGAGALSAGYVVDDLYEATDSLSDEELVEQSEFYRNLREAGKSEEEARVTLNKEMRGLKPLLMFGIGGAMGMIGPAGQVARTIAGGAATSAKGGVASRVGRAALEGAGSEFVEETSQAASVQHGEVAGGLRDEYDPYGAAVQGATAAVLGGTFGAGAGVASSGRGRRQAVDVGGTTVDTQGDTSVTPPEPGTAPAAPPRRRPRPKGVTVVPQGTPSPAESASLEANKPASPGAQAAPAPATPAAQAAPAPAAPAAPAVPRTPEGVSPNLDSIRQDRERQKQQRRQQTPIEPQRQQVPPAVEEAAQRVGQATQPVTQPVTQPAPQPVTPEVTPPAPVQPRPTAVPPAVAEASERIAKPTKGDAIKAKKGAKPKAEAPKEATPKVEEDKAPRTPRILPDKTVYAEGIDTEANVADLKKAEKEQAKRDKAEKEAIELALDSEKAAKDKVTKKGNTVKKLKEAERLDNEGSKALFAKHVPDDAPVPSKDADIDAVVQRVQSIMADAKKAGIKVPGSVRKQPDHLVWLKEVADMAKATTDGKRPSLKRVQEYVVSELAAKAGDFDFIRQKRKVEGDTASRGHQGDVEKKAAKPDKSDKSEEDAEGEIDRTDAESTEDVAAAEETVDPNEDTSYRSETQDAPAVVKKSEIRDRTSEGAASEGKSVKDKLSPEELARYASLAEKMKANEVPAAAKPAPRTKGEAIKPKSQDKATPKTPAQRVAAAAKETDRKPTEAQKKAGNYKKGKATFEGFEFSIETPKGARRTGTSPDGTEWSVKMPVHYGYIKGTKGADGDPVDVFFGPDLESDFVMVIDQVDPDTQAFDEHKVMFGFKGIVDAQEAYQDSFSDGRGNERAGDFRVMTVDEFKAWLDERGATKKPAGEPDMVTPEGNTFVRNMRDDNSPLRGVFESMTPEERAELEANVVDTDRTTLSGITDADRTLELYDSFASIDGNGNKLSSTFSKFADFAEREVKLVTDALAKRADRLPIAKSALPAIIKRIKSVAGDVPTFVMPDHQYELFVDKESLAAYDPTTHSILIKETHFLDRSEELPMTILHEGVHAAFIKETHNSPDIAYAVDMIAREVLAANPNVGKAYAFANVDEFIAEAFSNPGLQKLLMDTPASPDVVAIIQANSKTVITRKLRTLWDAVRMLVGHALGMNDLRAGRNTLLDAMLQVGAELEFRAKLGDQGPMDATQQIARAFIIDDMKDAEGSPWHQDSGIQTSKVRRMPQQVDKFFTPPPMQEQVSAPWLLKLRSMDQLALVAKDFFGKVNPVRKISDLTEQMRVTGDKIFRDAEPIIGRLHDLENKYKGVVVRHENGKPVTMWQEFTSLVHDETMTGAYADRPLDKQSHLGKDALWGKWAKAKHPELAARYQRLPSDLRAARKEAMEFFTKQQNAMSLGIIKNRILKALGVEDDALAKRIHEGNTTDADAELLTPHVMELILEAKELAKLEGPYFPLMRRGDFVVHGKYRITPPGNALRQINDNTWEFDSRDKAVAWAERQDTRPSIRSLWLDETTGEPWVTDTDGTEVRVHKNDTDAVQRFRVTVQDRHMDMFPTREEARAAAYELAKSRAFADVPGVEERRFDPGDRQADMLSSQLQSLINGLERREGYRGLTDMQKNELVQTLNQASIRYLGATRIQSRRLQRTYVEGASNDLTQNTLEYANSAAGYLARLQHQPALDEAMKELRAAVADDTRAYGKAGSLAKSSIANEVERRVHASTSYVEQSKYSSWVQRLMTASFIDKLAGPSYSMINATQPMMITFPELAARYGPGVAFRELSRAYSDIGAGKTIKKGLQHTLKKARQPSAEPLSLLEEVKSRVSAAEARMLTYLSERGSIDPDSGLEIHRMVKSRQGGVEGRVDQALGYMEGIGRQLPIAVETINRTTSALAAYRLEMSRSKDHDAAVAYAQEAVNRTQFLYSNTNAPPVFNHPVARVALQFKKFGQGMYHFMGYNIGKALRNAHEGDRAEAVKTLAYLMGTHMAIAGMLGLPTEPLKMLMIGAKAAGLGFGWEDVERWQREAMADFAGPEWGEALSRGLPRLIGIDLSSRIGLENLVSFGEPREYSESEVWAWAAKTAAGAPPGLVADWFKGAHQLSQGEFVKAAELMVPMKLASDSLRAYRQATEGKKSAAGNVTMEPYTAGEAAARVLGFTPRREAEAFERSSAFYAKSQSVTDQRTEFMREWWAATPSDRSKLWSRIVQFNRGQPRNVRITRSELNSYLKRKATEAKKGTVYKGMRTNIRTRHILDDVQGTYNIQ